MSVFRLEYHFLSLSVYVVNSDVSFKNLILCVTCRWSAHTLWHVWRAKDGFWESIFFLYPGFQGLNSGHQVYKADSLTHTRTQACTHAHTTERSHPLASEVPLNGTLLVLCLLNGEFRHSHWGESASPVILLPMVASCHASFSFSDLLS